MWKRMPESGFLFAALLGCGTALADTVTLQDGTVREGTIVQQDESGVTLEIRVGGLKGAVKIQRQEIASIQRQPLAPDAVEDEAAKLRAAAEALKGADAPKAAEAWVRLGDFYAGRTGYSSQAQAAFEKAMEIQPEDAAARQRLGHVKTAQGWQAVDVERRAKGLVPLDEVWVRPAERAWLIDRRHDEQTEELRVGPRRDDPFTKADVDKLLKIRAAEEEYRNRERLRLAYGESLLSRYGYYGNDGLDYIGSGCTPYYASGVSLSAGNSSFFSGTVGSGYYPYAFSPGFASGNFAFGTNFHSGYGSGFGFSFSGGSKNFRYNVNLGGYSGRSFHGGSTGIGFFGF